MRSARLVLACGAALAVTAGGCTAPVPGSALSPAARTPSPVAATSPAPTAAPTVVPAAAPVVVLDPGHNGRNAENPREINRPVPDGRGGTKPCNTTGTATDAGYAEHAFTWDVALRVQSRLTTAGVRVVLTRPDDDGVGPCVDERGRAGEAAGAVATVALHADGSAARDSGYHVAFSDPPLNPAQTGPARQLAVDLRDAMRAGGFRDSDYIGTAGLSPRSDLAGLSLATRPTVLVECANMRNPAEAAALSSPEGRDRYAAAVTNGILAFLAAP